MTYNPQKITKRLENLKATYQTLTVPQMKDPYHPTGYKNFGTGDRLVTLGYLRGYLKYAKVPTALMRASYAEAEELYQAKPVIYDDELLLGHLYLPEYKGEEKAEYDKLCEQFAMSAHTLFSHPPRKDHIALDFDKLLHLGIDGVKAEINAKLASLDLAKKGEGSDLRALRSWEFYQCCLIELDAVLDLASRYSEAAYNLANEKPSPRKEELIRLGEILEKVPRKPAESFYEAIQSVQFFLSTLFGLYPLARPDRYLYPYYKKDIESGKITPAFAQELIDNFCLAISDRVFTRAACGFIVGGTDENGNTVENELTYMFLTALDHLKLPDPNGALAVTDNASDGIINYCTEILSHGTTHPAFYNDRAIIDSLVKNYGVAPRDAVNYIHTTCAEISVIGKSKAHATPFVIDLPGHLINLVKKISPASFDELYEAYLKELLVTAQKEAQYYALRIIEAQRNGNDPQRVSVLIDDCIERGRGIYDGGARYTIAQPIFVGFATAVDSLVAINELVFKQGQKTLKELSLIAEDDFKSAPDLRAYIINKLPHYGNESPIADAMASKFAASLKNLFKESVPLWDIMMPGTFSYINHATIGEYTGATFDARRANTSFSDGCGPVQGRDVNGPTAMINSLTSWDQSAFLGGMVVNIKFKKSDFNASGGNILRSVLRTFVARGGIELQVNTVDRKTLIDAVENPENHRDLLVRIGGYSDYFTRLVPSLQNEIIERTEY